MSGWHVGMRVKSKPGIGDLYTDSPWGDKLAEPREGVVEEVPWFAWETGAGTLYVRFDSLTGDNSSDEHWCKWIHSDHLEAA